MFQQYETVCISYATQAIEFQLQASSSTHNHAVFNEPNTSLTEITHYMIVVRANISTSVRDDCPNSQFVKLSVSL